MKKIIILLSILVVSFTACTDLEIEPVSQITLANVSEDGNDAEALLIGCYNQLANTLSSRYIDWGDARADNLDQGTAGSASLVNNTLTSSHSACNWSSLYNTINRCNLVINLVPQITNGINENRKNEIIVEAKFIRALCYFYAVRLWGDVPLITEPTLSAEDLKVQRESKTAIYSQIEDDLSEALNNIPGNYNNLLEDKGRVTQGAVLALQTHVYLWIAQQEGGGDTYLSKAESTSKQIFDLNNYKLLPKGEYGLLFSQENTDESIFEIQYDYSKQNTNNLGSLLLQTPFSGSLRAHYKIDQKLLDAFEEGDLRKSDIVYYPEPEQLVRDPFTKKYTGKTKTSEGYSLRDDNMIIYRLGGIILLRAEILNEMDRTDEAISLVNLIRERAGLPNLETGLSKEETKQAILNERFIELAYEGHRWFDLIRNNVALEVLNDIQNEDHLLWPIYETELVKNPNLVQNDFY
ncbi:Starch-binding associating with outer membrane [Tangfeifania diversioriginum]|uniref:Starch-binding associating with outer membrane n=1 Tax=Tangfeifania diversioriginum TaxID=1168035 RepID=A0A1M6PSF2_9BACT|nr:RagB/SusD family nutrient uptake outer membrane protein [Tangfeifania diversioriginum]SHK10893.1 Starch-binding associating with outer membrane [Tangfeifania diversioriginum]